DADVARLALDLDDARVGAKGEAEVRGIVKGRLLEPGLEPLRIVVRHVRGEGHGAKRDRLAGSAFDGELATTELDVTRRRLEQVRRDLLTLLDDLVERHENGGAADRRRTAALGAHAERERPGVAVHDLDLLDRDTELVGRELGERRLVSLPVRVRARVDRDHPGR